MSYNAVYLNSVFNIVQEFAQYKNTLAFFSGNEVVNNANNSNAAPYVKAVTRDIRQFLKKRGLRKVPTGYSAVCDSIPFIPLFSLQSGSTMTRHKQLEQWTKPHGYWNVKRSS